MQVMRQLRCIVKIIDRIQMMIPDDFHHIQQKWGSVDRKEAIFVSSPSRKVHSFSAGFIVSLLILKKTDPEQRIIQAPSVFQFSRFRISFIQDIFRVVHVSHIGPDPSRNREHQICSDPVMQPQCLFIDIFAQDQCAAVFSDQEIAENDRRIRHDDDLLIAAALDRDQIALIITDRPLQISAQIIMPHDQRNCLALQIQIVKFFQILDALCPQGLAAFQLTSEMLTHSGIQKQQRILTGQIGLIDHFDRLALQRERFRRRDPAHVFQLAEFQDAFHESIFADLIVQSLCVQSCQIVDLSRVIDLPHFFCMHTDMQHKLDHASVPQIGFVFCFFL